MPLYEFQCHACSQPAEILVRSFSEKLTCPSCGSENLEKLMSVPAAPSMQGQGRSLPVRGSDNGSCGMPRCCGGGCQLP